MAFELFTSIKRIIFCMIACTQSKNIIDMNESQCTSIMFRSMNRLQRVTYLLNIRSDSYGRMQRPFKQKLQVFYINLIYQTAQMQKNQPKYISLEGNIGSGKSTILKIIKDNFPELVILDQPLSQWECLGENKNINLLQIYYKDPARFGLTFQLFTFMSRLNKWIEYSKEKGNGLRISQRSLLSDRYIFASIMHDINYLDEAQNCIYLQFYDYLLKMNKIVSLQGIIYVRCSPQVCQQRIQKRKRLGEDTIPFQYLVQIHEKHQQWIGREKQQNVLTIDNTNCINKEEIIESVGKWLEKIRKRCDNHQQD